MNKIINQFKKIHDNYEKEKKVLIENANRINKIMQPEGYKRYYSTIPDDEAILIYVFPENEYVSFEWRGYMDEESERVVLPSQYFDMTNDEIKADIKRIDDERKEQEKKMDEERNKQHEKYEKAELKRLMKKYGKS